MKDISAITGAEYAERLLAVNSPTRLIDHLIQKLAAKTGTGWESNLLEFKGSYHKRPDSDDPDSQDCFEWNVMHAFIALANAQGGCVVIGIAETDDHRLVPGDWDPDGILGCRDADGDGKPIPGREEKDLVDHVTSVFFKGNGRTYKFTKQNKHNPSAPPTAHEFTLDAETLSKLLKLVTFYPCHSERCSCNALAAIVHPVKKDDDLIEVCRTKKNRTENVIFYRDRRTAKTCELTKYRDIRNYEENREPASSDYLVELKTPLSRSVETSDIYTTMRSYDPNFVGRQKEIDAIRKICTGGKIVLIHAPGGTGKTELALKFAAEDAAQYPGGSFYVPAETTKTWSDVLRNLLDWKTSTTGVTPEEWLGLVSSDEQNQKQSANKQKDSQDKSIAKPTYGDSDVVNALIRKTLDRGPMLLVLDNVEAPGDLLATRAIKKVFQQGLPQGLHIIATARSRKGVTDRTCCETTTLSLRDVSTDDALAIINGAKEFDSADEKDAARKIIDILDHRALYVARIANLKNDFAERSFSRLLKKLLHDKLEVVKPTSDGDDPRTPTVFWQWTKQAIAKSDKRGKCIKLLQTLALFPADGMSADLLEYFWYSDFGKLDPPATLAAYKEDPDLFKDDLLRIDAYSLIQKDSTSNTLRMHRLDRAAIRRDLEDGKSSLRDEIGAALRDCPIFPNNGWVTLAQASSEFMNFCAWKMLDGASIAQILAINPKLQNKMINWGRLCVVDWWNLINRQPDFISIAISHAVPLTPLLAHKPKLLKHFNPDDFCGSIWARVLAHNPELADRCPFERLTKNDWLLLLAYQPELLSKCTHPEILNCSSQPIPSECQQVISKWNTANWGLLLSRQPSFAEKCDWNSLTLDDIISIFKEAPYYANRCPSISVMQIDGETWTEILTRNPELINLYPYSSFPRPYSPGKPHTVDLLAEQYGFQDDNGADWAMIFEAHPDLTDQCLFDKIPPIIWCELLQKDSTFKRFNPPWDLIGPLAQKESEFNIFATEINPLRSLLSLDELKSYQKDDLTIPFKSNHVSIQPPIEKLCNHPNLKSLSSFDSSFVSDSTLATLCEKFPQVRCALHLHIPVSAKQDFFPWNIGSVLLDAPEGLDYWHTETVNAKDDDSFDIDCNTLGNACLQLANNITSNDIKLFLDSPQADTKIVRIGNPVLHAVLICLYPQMADFFNWNQFSGHDLCLIMLNRPSLKSNCDWSKFSGHDWAVLLAKNPAFMPICNWSKLANDDWNYLLADRPWLAEFRKQHSSTAAPTPPDE